MKKRWIVFTAYLVVTLLFYHKSLQVYFLSDDWKLFYLLDRYGISAIKFNFESEFIRIIPCVLLSILYFLFGISSALPFHLLSVLLHALNAFLVFVLVEKIFSRYLQQANNLLYSLIAGLIFIALPYQVEAVTWMSGTSDLLACSFVLLSLIFYFNYKNSEKGKYLLLSALFFLLAVLSKESSLFLPLLIIVLEIFSARQKKQALLAIYLIPVLAYALLNKFFTGYFITPGVNIFTNMPFFLFLKNYFLYTAKFFALYRILPHEIREALKVVFEHKMIVIPVWGIALFIMYKVRKKASLKSGGKLMVLMLIAFIISLVPVIHLETSFVGSPQSDRYGYLPSVFFVILLAAIAMLINKKSVAITGLAVLLIWFYVAVQAQNRNWVNASNMVEKIVVEFKPVEGVSYITNMPDNFNGAYILRNGLGEALSVVHREDFAGRINMLSYQNITSDADKARAEKMSDSTYRVTFAKPEKKIPESEKIFTLVPGTARYLYSEISDTSFVVTIKQLPLKNNFYYYSGGSLNVIH